MREHYEAIVGAGAEVVAVGTGDIGYARDFIATEAIPFPVLVDDDGAAARAASVRVSSFPGLFHPRTWGPTRRTWRLGYRIHRAGARPTQLGATFVVAPGPSLLYEHLDRDSTDHAPMAEVLAALGHPRAT